jgi:protein TonB
MAVDPYFQDDELDERGFFARNRIAIILGVVALLLIGGVVTTAIMLSGQHISPPKPQEFVVHLLPPPPQPPPPPPPPPPKEPPPPPKMVEQPPVNKPEEKPKDTPKAPDRPPAPGPVATGPPSDEGIGGGGGTGGGGTGGGGGSKYGWFAGEVQSAITDALGRNDKTRAASVKIKVRIWSDGTGRITRAELANSTGDASLDDAIKNEVLTGLQIPDSPPSDMPMPIVLRITELRPN